jgi:hypothetical protein
MIIMLQLFTNDMSRGRETGEVRVSATVLVPDKAVS